METYENEEHNNPKEMEMVLPSANKMTAKINVLTKINFT